MGEPPTEVIPIRKGEDMDQFKDIPLNINIGTKRDDYIRTHQKLYSQDQNSARLVIKLLKNDEELDTSKLKLISIFMTSSDRYGRPIKGLEYQVDLQPTENTHIIPNEYLRYCGWVVIHVYVYYLEEEASNDVGQAFLLSFNRSAIDDSSAEDVVPDYFQRFDDITQGVQDAADQKLEEIEAMGIDIGEMVRDYLEDSPDIATKEYVEIKTTVSDRLLSAWLILESEGEN